MRNFKALPSLLLCFCLIAIRPAIAQSMSGDDDMHHHHHDADEKLGKVSFPISCAPGSQASFERGVALLHSFGYEEAEEQFTDLTKADPACAMAHWGIAMSLFHQIWERPEDATLVRGHAEIEKAKQIGAKTDRERAYISALGVFYSSTEKKDYPKQASAYSDAMGKIYEKYPNDMEAGAFYALSLLASAPPGDATHANAKKAVAVLNVLFEKQPDHPGLAHYIIHSCDSPDMAQYGLAAARRYAAIAPSSAHAVHMPSHIFARLGLWQEDIAANQKSVELTEKSTAMYMGGHELHALHFMLYAYMQTGQDDAAKQILDKSQTILARASANGDDTGMLEYYGYAAADFPAIYALEMQHWQEAAALMPAAISPPHDQMITYWARTIGAARMGDAESARQDAKKFSEIEDSIRKTKDAYTLEGPHVMQDEVKAWVAFAEKRNDDALQIMRQVADTQDKVGKREVDIPAREMLADMLVTLNQPESALAEYERSMKIDPNRFNGLAGAAHAAELAHQPAKANTYYAQLLKNCDDGKHSDRPQLRRAKTELAKNTH